MQHLYSTVTIYKHQKYLLWLLLAGFTAVNAQERKPVKGLVYAGNAGIADVLVVNFTGQSEARTDNTGHFTLSLQVGDLIIISGSNIETKKIRFTPDLINNSLLQLEVNLTGEVLEEVVINRSTVSSASLGIPMGKKYTPAERRLRTAGDFKPVHLLGLFAGRMELDPIINAINGRTKRLKKELKAEEREHLLIKIREAYPEQELTDKYKIPADHTDGFTYFIVEDASFGNALLTGNKADADMQIASLSTLYLEYISHEN